MRKIEQRYVYVWLSLEKISVTEKEPITKRGKKVPQGNDKPSQRRAEYAKGKKE